LAVIAADELIISVPMPLTAQLNLTAKKSLKDIAVRRLCWFEKNESHLILA